MQGKLAGCRRLPGLAIWTLDHVFVRIKWHLTFAVPVTYQTCYSKKPAKVHTHVTPRCRLTQLFGQAELFASPPAGRQPSLTLKPFETMKHVLQQRIHRVY